VQAYYGHENPYNNQINNDHGNDKENNIYIDDDDGGWPRKQTSKFMFQGGRTANATIKFTANGLRMVLPVLLIVASFCCGHRCHPMFAVVAVRMRMCWLPATIARARAMRLNYMGILRPKKHRQSAICEKNAINNGQRYDMIKQSYDARKKQRCRATAGGCARCERSEMQRKTVKCENQQLQMMDNLSELHGDERSRAAEMWPILLLRAREATCLSLREIMKKSENEKNVRRYFVSNRLSVV
jgi:hypothetical protein